MIVDAVTTRWAEALDSAAKKQGASAAVRADVARLASALATPGGGDAFHPRLDREERRRLVLGKLGGAHALVVNFVGLVFDRRREDVLRGIGRAFKRLELAERGIVEGVVESARPLGAAELATLAREVGAHLGKQVELRNEIVPELVGGVRVRAANRMIDWSVQGRLETLRRRLLEVPLAPAAR